MAACGKLLLCTLAAWSPGIYAVKCKSVPVEPSQPRWLTGSPCRHYVFGTAVFFVGGAGGGSVVAEATFEGGESLAPSVAITR